MTQWNSRSYNCCVKSVFFGTPAIAVPALRALAQVTQVVGVVCQPDRAQGRGLHTTAGAVKQAALELGLEVYQPEKVRDGKLAHWLEQRQPDLALVLAYGRILPQSVLDTPKYGCLNLHASLLPKYRGAAPIQWALLQGETETGISLMRMDAGLDTGPVYCEHKLPVPPTMDAGELSSQLAQLAAQVVTSDLLRAITEQTPTAQDESQASWAPPITSEHTQLDWTRSALQLHNQIRALSPRPGAFSSVGGKRLKLLATAALAPLALGGTLAAAAPPGHVLRAQGDQLWVATGSGILQVLQAQLEGKRALSARDLINGRSLEAGMVLGG